MNLDTKSLSNYIDYHIRIHPNMRYINRHGYCKKNITMSHHETVGLRYPLELGYIEHLALFKEYIHLLGMFI